MKKTIFHHVCYTPGRIISFSYFIFKKRMLTHLQFKLLNELEVLFLELAIIYMCHVNISLKNNFLHILSMNKRKVMLGSTNIGVKSIMNNGTNLTFKREIKTFKNINYFNFIDCFNL